MFQAFMIVLREGFEGFLIVAIILAYLKKTGERWLEPAVYCGVIVSLLVSAGVGYLLREGVHQSLWEGILGTVTVFLVGTLVYQMWRVGPKFKTEVEQKLFNASSSSSRLIAGLSVFIFSVLMISREGIEMAIMLIQVKESRFITGAVLGVFAAIGLSYVWMKLSYLINLKRFFKVTSIFLVLFLFQVAIYSFHEFAEAGIFPNSEALHVATEQFSPVGIYGKWFSFSIVFICIVWLIVGWIGDQFSRKTK